MAYAIIAAIIVVVIGWALFMSRRAKAGHVEKFSKPSYRGSSVRRFTFGGRKIIQSDEQRTEMILQNRERHDPSIDKLDPRHPDYKKPEAPST